MFFNTIFPLIFYTSICGLILFILHYEFKNKKTKKLYKLEEQYLSLINDVRSQKHYKIFKIIILGEIVILLFFLPCLFISFILGLEFGALSTSLSESVMNESYNYGLLSIYIFIISLLIKRLYFVFKLNSILKKHK